MEALVRDRALCDITAEATIPCVAIARRIGKAAPWAAALGRLSAMPRALRLALGVGGALGRATAPELVAYIDAHFAGKLAAQHRAMAAAIAELRADGDPPLDALDRLVARTRNDTNA
jgi:hypothetical protein